MFLLLFIKYSNQIKLVSYSINGDLLDSIENSSENVEKENIQANVISFHIV